MAVILLQVITAMQSCFEYLNKKTIQLFVDRPTCIIAYLKLP
jgi:hypothetical protein